MEELENAFKDLLRVILMLMVTAIVITGVGVAEYYQRPSEVRQVTR
jgi:hypothetical protein